METVYANDYGTLIRHTEIPARSVAPRPVDVWCPPGYSIGEQRYPVIYMADGQNAFLPGYSYTGEAWGMDEALVRLIQAGRARPALVAALWNTGAGRAAEYTPQKPLADPAAREAARTSEPPFWGESIADAYLQYLVADVKPFIDAQYRTQPEQAHTFTLGSSRGGLISLYALIEYPQVFGGAGGLSTHWPAGGDALVDYCGRRLPPPGRHKLYFDHGTETLDRHYAPFQARMDEHLRQAGYTEGRDWITRRFPGAEHSERAWRERVHLPLEFLLAV